jgi:hypothetical protein
LEPVVYLTFAVELENEYFECVVGVRGKLGAKNIPPGVLSMNMVEKVDLVTGQQPIISKQLLEVVIAGPLQGHIFSTKFIISGLN